MDLTSDYLIVGGGSAGCVLAARLSEDPNVSVTLLEAGPEDRSVFIHCPAGLAVLAKTGQANWRFETTPQPGLQGRRGYQPRGKVLGGSSSVNAMIYTRGVPEDYDAWARAGNPGWAWQDVLPYFVKAEHNERGPDALHGGAGPLNVMDLCDPNPYSRHFIEAGVQAGYPHNPDFNGVQQEGVGLYQVTHRRGERFSAARAYLGPARSRPNLRVITDARATRILFQQRRATGVEFIQQGRRQTVGASREVILSAGALQSPQLLMLSGVGPGPALQKAGIAVHHHLAGVGQHLQDHPDVVAVYDAPGHTDLFGLSLAGLVRTWRAIGQWRRERRGMLTTNFAEAGGFIRSQAAEPVPDLQLHFVVGKLVNHGRTTTLGHGYSCHVCLLRPQSRGSVELAGLDPLAAPLINPNFLSHPDDIERMVRGWRLMRHILSQPALGRFGARETPEAAAAHTDVDIAQYIRAHADTIYHPAGSCRMGSDSASVVDAQLRVHGLQGLRVVDASIMPALVGGNTNAPVIMIAEKAAHLIKNPVQP